METLKLVAQFISMIGGLFAFILFLIRAIEAYKVHKLKRKSIKDQKKQEAMKIEFEKLKAIFGEKEGKK